MTKPNQVQAPHNAPRTPPYKTAGLVLLVIFAGVLAFVAVEFRGGFVAPETLTLFASRSGLSMDPGAKVTYNGVEIGRVSTVSPATTDQTPSARIVLDVNKSYIHLIPRNVDAEIKASTVFGNKYIAFSSPAKPDAARVSSNTPIRAAGVTTEFNTLFETVVSVAEQVDPVKLNATLSATAQALSGLGSRFGQSLDDLNVILDDLNPRMPRIREDLQKLAGTADVLADAAPDLFDALGNGLTTVRTLNAQQRDLDRALMASVGFGNTGGDVLERTAPYLVRTSADLVPTTALLDEYSPAIFCALRNYHDVEPKIAAALGGNGYSLRLHSELMGAGNPYVYPDNLPRVNAHGGPEGRPGCWQPVTRDLWPAPYLVMDTGASLAPYNHFSFGKPMFLEYVWGRQAGDNTINP